MKLRTALLSCFLFLAVAAQAQFRLVGTSSWTAVNDTTWTGTVTFPPDLTGQGYLPTQIVDTFKVFSVVEQQYRIDTVANKTFSSADLTIVRILPATAAPVGQVMVYDPAGKDAVPQFPLGSAGTTAQMQAAVVTFNAKQAGGGGGGGSTEVADGVTILGLGSAGDPFRADTNLLATQNYADVLHDEQADSLNNLRTDLTAVQAQADTLPTQSSVDSLHNAQQATLDTQADSLAAHRADLDAQLDSLNNLRTDLTAVQAQADTLPTQGFVDSLHQVVIDSLTAQRNDIDAQLDSLAQHRVELNTQADTLTAHRTDIETLKPRIRYFTPTASVFTLDTLATVNVLDYTSVAPFVSTTVHIDSSGGIGPYFFHARGTGQQVVDFPAHFLDAAGVAVDGSSLYILVEDQLWDCYLDPTMKDFYCNTKTFLTEEFVPFITTWDTRLVSPTAGTDTLATDSLSVRLPLQNGGTYGFIAEWGDGTASYINAWDSPEVVHVYDTAGTYTITLTGTINGWRFNNLGDRTKITDISQWGDLVLINTGIANEFYGCSNLNISDTGPMPVYFGIGANLFRECSNLETVNLSAAQNVTLTGILRSCPRIKEVNIPSNVAISGTQTTFAFNGCDSLVSLNAAGWNMSAMQSLQGTFGGCKQLNLKNVGIENWNVSNVTNFSSFATGTATDSLNLNTWDVSSGTDFSLFFAESLVLKYFNGSNWDVSSGTDFWRFFRNCKLLEETNLSSWNMSSATRISQMFLSASIFKRVDVSSWNVDNVSDMSLFVLLTDVDTISLQNWDIVGVTNLTSMASNLDSLNYNEILNSWSSQNANPNLSSSFGTSKYTAAGQASRNLLTRANATVPVTGAVNNAGEIQITATAHGRSTGDKVLIYDVGGTVEANGGWIITVIDANNFTLDGSVFTNAYTSGGTVRTGFGWTVSDGGLAP